jgi:formate dehydrogenase subunit delta
MNVDRLVAMVNDIAAFFAGEAGPGAPAAVANHLRRFWEPRMRSQIIATYRNDPSSLRNLSEIGRAAIAVLADDDDARNAKVKMQNAN